MKPSRKIPAGCICRLHSLDSLTLQVHGLGFSFLVLARRSYLKKKKSIFEKSNSSWLLLYKVSTTLSQPSPGKNQHWKWLSREVVDATFLEMFKTGLDGALSNVIQWNMSLHMAGGLDYMILKVPSNANHPRKLEVLMSKFLKAEI